MRNTFFEDPTVAICLGTCGEPWVICVLHEQGTPVTRGVNDRIPVNHPLDGVAGTFHGRVKRPAMGVDQCFVKGLSI